MIDLRSLEIFYWVATLESFGRAAERLYTTQPAVSQRVAGLETELGHRLFERSGRSIHLTPKGRHLLGYAERLLRLHTEMVQTIAAGEQLGGVVRLGVAETIVQTWLSDFIEQVNTRHPTVTFEIEVAITPDLKQALLRQEMDLAFVTGPLSEPESVAIHDVFRRFYADPGRYHHAAMNSTGMPGRSCRISRAMAGPSMVGITTSLTTRSKSPPS